MFDCVSRVVVDGQTIFYRAYTVSPGVINVGYLHCGSALNRQKSLSMNTQPQFRKPTNAEQALLQRLLEVDFPGRDQLAPMIQNVFVRTIDAVGGLELQSQVSGMASVVKRIPVEAEAKDEDGVTIHVLLHVIGGRPVELEIFKDDSSRVKHMPSPAAFELTVLPPAPKQGWPHVTHGN